MTEAPSSCHGVLLSVAQSGLLIVGAPGSGKSALALELLNRGHRLVADDVVELQAVGGKLMGSAPSATQGLLHLRSLGLINIGETIGPQALRTGPLRVDLAINLEQAPEQDPDYRLHGCWDEWTLNGVSLPRLRLDPATAFTATLAELAARTQARAIAPRPPTMKTVSS